MKGLKTLCYILVLALALSSLPVSAVSVTGGDFVSRLSFAVDDDTVLRAIVLFNGDAGIDLQQKGRADTAAEAGEKVHSLQKSLTAEIKERFGVSPVYSYSVLLNGIAVDASYGTLKAIEKLQGVKGVYLANSFASPKAEEAPAASTVGDPLGMGTDLMEGNGAGAVIAVLDTSFYLKHEAFGQTANVKQTLTAQDIQNFKDSPLGLNGNGQYISAKVPYAFDYADNDMNVANSASHGTAVASIALGDNGTSFHGVARNAQLLAMKVFSDSSGNTDSSVYFYAIEDAYTMGADVINMSFGAQNGFTYDYELEDLVFGNVYQKMKERGVFVICAAGNEYSQGYKSYAYNRYSVKYGVDGVTADYADYGVVGTPSTYADNISVAAAENVKHFAYAIKVGNTAFEYFDKAESLYEHFYSNFAGRALEYVVVPGYGSTADYSSINARGRIAVVKRGGITDSEKLSAAAKAGAIGLICANDREGSFYLSYNTYTIPSATVSQDAYEAFAKASSKTLTVSMGVLPVANYMAGTMCDFSSWGVAPDMTLKPNITGIGGGVLCAGSTSTEDYTLMSGTSMAAPTIAGFFASALMAVSFGKNLSRTERYEKAYSLIFSTASTLSFEDGVPYSPRRQGVGMPVCSGLGSTVAFKNPIVQLGDDPSKKGVYTINARLLGLYSDMETATLTFEGADVITDNFVYDSALGATYNTLTPYRLNATVKADKASYAVSASGNTSVKLTITLSEQDKQYLSAADNGAFVEGYAYFTYTAGGDVHRIKLTFLGFYGDWMAAPAFESYDWGEVIDQMVWMMETKEPISGKTYAELGYTVYNFLDTNLGFNEAYFTDANGEDFAFLGDNLYKNVYFDKERMAFSTAAANGSHIAEKITFYPSLLRNLSHIIMTVSNADTGEVYYVDDTAYSIKDFFNTQTNEFDEGTYFQWDGTAKNGKYVPDGTKIKITFETQLAVEGAPLKTEREYILRVDNQAPGISYSWNAATKKLTVSAADAGHISNVFVFVGDYDRYIVDEAVTTAKAGETYTVTYDLSGASFGAYNSFSVEVQDYATNYTTIDIPLGEDSTNIELLTGDVNFDGSVDNLDAVSVLKYDTGTMELNDEQLQVGDANHDSMVDNLDATLILKYDAGLINGF